MDLSGVDLSGARLDGTRLDDSNERGVNQGRGATARATSTATGMNVTVVRTANHAG